MLYPDILLKTFMKLLDLCSFANSQDRTGLKQLSMKPDYFILRNFMLTLPNGSFPIYLKTILLYTFLLSLMHAICSAQPISQTIDTISNRLCNENCTH